MLAVSACCRSTRTATLFSCGSSAMRSIPSCSKCPPARWTTAEDAEECGIRELKEETGCTAGRIVPLGAIYPSPGFLTEVTYLFAALDLTEGEMQPDEDEFVEVVRLPIAEVEKMIEQGRDPRCKNGGGYV